MPRPRPWVLAETTWAAVRESPPDVVVLPWGATEAHNFHLPYGTDVYEATAIAEEAGRLAWERGARVAILPTLPFGVQTGQLDLPLCMNVDPSTQAALLGDLASALDGQGIPKLVILNGHGGNDFKAMVRELQPHLDLFLSVVDWYACLDPSPFFEEPGDHGGEMETALMMHVARALVRPLEEAGPGYARPWTVEGLREGWAWAPRQWTRLTDDTGVGDPAAATPEKGRAYFEAVTDRIASYLVELAAVDLDALYE
ncbi:MAG: creatininase family protein [Gemmatimonadota bacterium]